jgi:phospholipase D1/2
MSPPSTVRDADIVPAKNHSRLMPFLIPPTDFTPAEISKLKLAGTCEAQICRSAGPWSLGTSKRIECSIQNAYCKAIQLSEAFVYIENQYFSTSSVAENVAIENHIGDALVSRILRAHNEGMPWKACIIIPLTPGYAMPMDSPDAGNVRMIMEAQSRSIYRGEHSLFARLRREGIDPADYINFFSLRSWGKFKTGQLTTQDIYIHDKARLLKWCPGLCLCAGRS